MKSDTTAFIHDRHQEATLKGICSALRTAASEWGGLWETYCSSPAPLSHPVPQASQSRTLGHVLGWREFIPVTYAPFNTQERGEQTSMWVLVRSRVHFELLWYCNADPILTKVLIFHSTTKMSMLMPYEDLWQKILSGIEDRDRKTQNNRSPRADCWR